MRTADRIIYKHLIKLLQTHGKTPRSIALILIIVIGVLVITTLTQSATKTRLSGDAFEVVRVVDGDTIEVKQGDLKETVRYIGVNTPETVKPNSPVECFGKAASEYNTQLVKGKTVLLEKDVEDRDRYGRLLRYVYLADDTKTMINKKIVADGYAYASAYPPNVAYQDELEKLESSARNSQKGLWNECEKSK